MLLSFSRYTPTTDSLSHFEATHELIVWQNSSAILWEFAVLAISTGVNDLNSHTLLSANVVFCYFDAMHFEYRPCTSCTLFDYTRNYCHSVDIGPFFYQFCLESTSF